MSYPSAVLTVGSTLASAEAIYYNRQALDRLLEVTLFHKATEPDVIPKRNGRVCVWFRYGKLGAKTTPAVEGQTSSSGASISSRAVTATVSRFANFTTVSDMLEAVSPDPVIENAARLLGEQAALTIDTLIRTVVDNASSNFTQAPLGTYLTLADLRVARHVLRNNLVPPREGGYMVIASPLVIYDLVQDPSAGGFLDLMKNLGIKDGVVDYAKPGEPLFTVANCQVFESTNVHSSGNPAQYRTYIFGKGGLGAVSIAGFGPTYVTDPSTERFAVTVKRNLDVSPSNPEGVIKAIASYNFTFGCTFLDGPAAIGGTYRMRVINTVSSIG